MLAQIAVAYRRQKMHMENENHKNFLTLLVTGFAFAGRNFSPRGLGFA